MRIIFTHADGSTAIMIPELQERVAKILPEVANMTQIEYANFIAKRDVPVGSTNINIVSATDIPTDRTFRNALKHDLIYDKQKCIDMTNNRLRTERAPLLAELDVQMLIAFETGAPTANIVAEKQRLRDITKIAKPSMTLEELKSIKVR